MAAATIAEGNHITVFGNKKVRFAKLTAPADGSTWDTNLSTVEGVFVQQLGDIAAGTDVITVDTISSGVATFSVDGTARDVYVLAIGR